MVKVLEIIEASTADIPHLKALVGSPVVLSKIGPESVKNLLDLIQASTLANIFPLYDFLRCLLLTRQNAEWLANEGFAQFAECIKFIEGLQDAVGPPVEAETPEQKQQGNILFTAS